MSNFNVKEQAKNKYIDGYDSRYTSELGSFLVNK